MLTSLSYNLQISVFRVSIPIRSVCKSFDYPEKTLGAFTHPRGSVLTGSFVFTLSGGISLPKGHSPERMPVIGASSVIDLPTIERIKSVKMTVDHGTKGTLGENGTRKFAGSSFPLLRKYYLDCCI